MGQKLKRNFGEGNVHFSGDCNNLVDTLRAQIELCGINVFDLVPLSQQKLIEITEKAQEHGTKALYI